MPISFYEHYGCTVMVSTCNRRTIIQAKVTFLCKTPRFITTIFFILTNPNATETLTEQIARRQRGAGKGFSLFSFEFSTT